MVICCKSKSLRIPGPAPEPPPVRPRPVLPAGRGRGRKGARENVKASMREAGRRKREKQKLPKGHSGMGSRQKATPVITLYQLTSRNLIAMATSLSTNNVNNHRSSVSTTPARRNTIFLHGNDKSTRNASTHSASYMSFPI